jgi:hypothetical protein
MAWWIANACLITISSPCALCLAERVLDLLIPTLLKVYGEHALFVHGMAVGFSVFSFPRMVAEQILPSVSNNTSHCIKPSN